MRSRPVYQFQRSAKFYQQIIFSEEGLNLEKFIADASATECQNGNKAVPPLCIKEFHAGCGDLWLACLTKNVDRKSVV